MQETWARSLGQKDPPEKEMASHSQGVLGQRSLVCYSPQGHKSLGHNLWTKPQPKFQPLKQSILHQPAGLHVIPSNARMFKVSEYPFAVSSAQVLSFLILDCWLPNVYPNHASKNHPHILHVVYWIFLYNVDLFVLLFITFPMQQKLC